MPTETELREWLNGLSPEPGRRALDAGAIIRGSRRRRMPRQFALGGTAALAVASIGFAGFGGLRAFLPGGAEAPTASDPAGSAPPDSLMMRAPAEKLNPCGGALAEVAPNPAGLVLSVAFPASAPGNGEPVVGTVLVSNTSAERVTGASAVLPAITVSQDGLVLWHSNGPMIAMARLVDLAPGESTEYAASFLPVRCGAEDDLAESFRADLPALEPGVYQVSAAIDVVPDMAPDQLTDFVAGLVTGPAVSITLE